MTFTIVRICTQSILSLLLGIALVSCVTHRGDGPLLVNTSGASVHVTIHSSDGSRIQETLTNQSAVWAGRARAHVEYVEVDVGEARFLIQGEALVMPYGKDSGTAFIIEATGPRKLTMAEARILMDRR